MRIWAEAPETKTDWHTRKDIDQWLGPAAGYRAGAKPELYTFTFTP
jgi:hypothetical protein